MGFEQRSSFLGGQVGAASALLLAIVCTTARASAQSAAPEPAAAPTPAAEPAPSPAELPPNDAEAPRVAELQPMQPGQGMVFVNVSAGEHPFTVYFGKGKLPIADCSSACGFWAWPGKYRVHVVRGEGPGYDAVLSLRIRKAGSYEFVHANGEAQNAGLILGVTGPAIAFVGLIFTAAGLLATCSDPPPGQTCDRPTALYVGLGGLALGGAMTAVGWPMYIHNRAHFELTDSVTPAPRVGLVRMPQGGLGLGATFAF